MGHVTLEEIVEQIQNQYKQNFKCGKFAEEMERLMKITNYLYSDKYGVISKNGIHYAIKIGDMIHDNLNPTGIDYHEWLMDLGITEVPSLVKIVMELID